MSGSPLRGLRVMAGLCPPAPLPTTPGHPVGCSCGACGFLRARLCTEPGPCRNRQHDHLDEDDQPLRCPDCGLPTHYDLALEDYRHDDPNARCFLQP